jgi:hypothetical protein
LVDAGLIPLVMIRHRRHNRRPNLDLEQRSVGILERPSRSVVVDVMLPIAEVAKHQRIEADRCHGIRDVQVEMTDEASRRHTGSLSNARLLRRRIQPVKS